MGALKSAFLVPAYIRDRIRNGDTARPGYRALGITGGSPCASFLSSDISSSRASAEQGRPRIEGSTFDDSLADDQKKLLAHHSLFTEADIRLSVVITTESFSFARDVIRESK